jgi:hypothetical protein
MMTAAAPPNISTAAMMTISRVLFFLCGGPGGRAPIAVGVVGGTGGRGGTAVIGLDNGLAPAGTAAGRPAGAPMNFSGITWMTGSIVGTETGA